MDMKTLYLCVIFAALGLVEDYIVSRYYLALARKQAGRTAAISLVHTLLAIFVVASIIRGDSVPLMICYAVGGAGGTWLGVRFG
jgi:hypothetical protein